jgi:hypothetical protein
MQVLRPKIRLCSHGMCVAVQHETMPNIGASRPLGFLMPPGGAQGQSHTSWHAHQKYTVKVPIFLRAWSAILGANVSHRSDARTRTVLSNLRARSRTRPASKDTSSLYRLKNPMHCCLASWPPSAPSWRAAQLWAGGMWLGVLRATQRRMIVPAAAS